MDRRHLVYRISNNNINDNSSGGGNDNNVSGNDNGDVDSIISNANATVPIEQTISFFAFKPVSILEWDFGNEDENFLDTKASCHYPHT